MRWQLDSAVVSDRGCVRELNEDAARIVQPGDADARRDRGVLVVVADGMGGHSAGEVASQMAVDTINRAYYDASGTPTDALVAAMQAANHAIFTHASGDASLTGMGTTCVALAVADGFAHAAHAGDSRLYLIRRGGIYQMTNDDSAVGEMVNRGVITKEDARHHHEKNVILKALGTRPAIEISSWPSPLAVADGDVFLLCSDGLTDLVDDQELADVVRGDAESADTCRALIALAKSRGGFDNITAALVRVSERAAATAPPRDTRQVGAHS